jgi:uncharacterized protein (TIGR02453 family)
MALDTVFPFLKDLAENNTKEWFERNKSRYEAVKSAYHALAGNILDKMKQQDPSLECLEVKNCTFRIYKDTRFSKDKTPYKTSLGIILTPYGKKMHLAGYYVHLEDGKSFVGGGLYMPPNDMVKKVRNEIMTFSEEFLSLVNDRQFISTFGTLDMSPQFMLKKYPKDISPDNHVADYTRLKSFTTGKHYTNEEVLSKEFIPNCCQDLTKLKGVIHFINRGLSSDEYGGV